MAPPAFENPHEIEGRIDEIEKACKARECTNEEKVRFTIFMLHDKAHHWWKSMEHIMTCGYRQVTWQKFHPAF